MGTGSMSEQTDAILNGAGDLEAELGAIANAVETLAEQNQGDVLALLALLRTLEASHRSVCDRWFQECLPDNRQRLYNLLRDMEAEGGWPYIPRMRLKKLLSNMPSEVQDAIPDDRKLK